MSLLDRFRSRRREAAARRSITDRPHWHIDGADFHRVLRALPEFVPAGSVLGLAEGAWPNDVRTFLDEHEVSLEAQVSTLPADFKRARFLPVDPPTIRKAAVLADGHAEPEIATHLVVVHEGVTVIEWYDLPSDPMAVSSSVDETIVARFAGATGGRYSAAKAGA